MTLTACKSTRNEPKPTWRNDEDEAPAKSDLHHINSPEARLWLSSAASVRADETWI
ncbi:hypothetical protein BRAS3843_3260084 [Bradyrhizobium sp. STM 3843]|nr:hypothetical protein BRAS3843_3260084 [Bradyrhizobium sp. STM 3843]